jgi:DNA-binding transcriptional ArsR family regulator
VVAFEPPATPQLIGKSTLAYVVALEVFKALADPTRRTILDELTDREGQTLFILAGEPGEGPCAASITLLEARATDDRVPSLVADLVSLRERLSHPLRVELADGSMRAQRR